MTDRMKKISKSIIKKAVAERGYEFKNFEINKNSITTSMDNILLGNFLVKNVVKTVCEYGKVMYHAHKKSDGAWVYIFNSLK